MRNYVQTIREKIGHDMLLVPSTTCLIVNNDGEILLQHRSDNELWGCPGGIMELGETVFEGMQREVKEETNLDITHATLFGIYSGPASEETYPNGDKACFVNHTFITSSYEGDIQTDAESLDLTFFPLDNLPEIVPDQLRIFEDFKKVLSEEAEMPFIE